MQTKDYEAMWDELKDAASKLEQVNNLPHLIQHIEERNTYKHVIVKNEVDRPWYEDDPFEDWETAEGSW